MSHGLLASSLKYQFIFEQMLGVEMVIAPFLSPMDNKRRFWLIGTALFSFLFYFLFILSNPFDISESNFLLLQQKLSQLLCAILLILPIPWDVAMSRTYTQCTLSEWCSIGKCLRLRKTIHLDRSTSILSDQVTESVLKWVRTWLLLINHAVRNVRYGGNIRALEVIWKTSQDTILRNNKIFWLFMHPPCNHRKYNESESHQHREAF